MAKITFSTDLCKGCGLCVAACPKGSGLRRLRLLRNDVPRLRHHRRKVERTGTLWQIKYL